MKTVAKNIKKYRLEKGLSQEEFANLVNGLNVTQVSIKQYECGIVVPCYEILKDIALALDVPVCTLIGITNEQRYDIYKKNFGDRIRYKRKELNLTQAQLGSLLNVKEISIRQYENGRNIPRGARLYDLADVLKTSLNYLLVGKE